MVEWSLNYADISTPIRINNVIKMEHRQQKRSFMNFGLANSQVIKFNNQQVAQDIANRLKLAYNNYF